MSHANDPGTFSIAATTRIEAPIDLVWKVLLDFPQYGEWNSFVRKQEVVGADSQDNKVPEVGKQLNMITHIPPTMDDAVAKKYNAKCIVTVIDHENHSAEWRADMLPSMLLRSYRVQRLREEKDDDGRKVTVYETKEAFGGLFARGVQWSVGKGLQEAFEAMGQGLKKRSEELAKVP